MGRLRWACGGPADRGDALIVTKTPVARLGVAMASGRLRCSGCDGSLRPWGYARRRWVRDRGRYQRFRPRRARCTACRRTHVVLPDRMLLRRLDRVEVIGAALTASAGGVGVRTISRRLELPPTTVRGWIRRFAARSRDGGSSDQQRPSALVAVLASPATPGSGSAGARWRRASRDSHGQFLR
jgi:transposase-like protein